MPNQATDGTAPSFMPALIIGIALAAGVTSSLLGYGATAGTVANIVEELTAVNETIHSNAEQFSLVPYAEDPDEFRDAIESWRGYLREVCNMATNAIMPAVEDNVHITQLGNCAIFAIVLMLPLCFFSGAWAATALAFLLPVVLSAILAAANVLAAMAWVNQGLMRVVGDLRESAMEKLLSESNHNDDFLQAMLLATGHLTNIDEHPFWLCVQLPWPLNLRIPSAKAAFHGGAWTEGCVVVTWDTLSWFAAAMAGALPLGVSKVWRALLVNQAQRRRSRVRIQE